MKHLLQFNLKWEKKIRLSFLFLFLFTTYAGAQITETFDVYPPMMTLFGGANDVYFNLNPPTDFYTENNVGLGYSGSPGYIDNFNSAFKNYIIFASIPFNLKSLYIYPSVDMLRGINQKSGVGITLIGKLASATIFTYTLADGLFADADMNNSINRGYSLIDMAVPGYNNAKIDELDIVLSGSTAYFAIDNFTWAPATPAITSISPASGPIAGGTSVTITGVNFTGATAVKFGTTAATGLVVNSATKITVTSPSGSVGTKDITVTTPVGTSATGSADLFSYYTSPDVTISPASSVSSTSAILNGTVNANNATSIVTFEYGLSTSYGSSATAAQSPVAGTSITSVSSSLTGLTPNTTYHYRVKAINAAGTSIGGDYTFTTLPIVPTVATSDASNVYGTTATLNGTVNANNATSIVTFEYGLSTSYGSSATAAQSPVAGTSITSVSSSLTGLTPNTTYHYRVKAINAAGTSVGADNIFATVSTGINTVESDKIGFYPNPVKEVLYISGLNGTAQLIVTDVNGKEVLVSNVSDREGVAVNSLSPGIYFAKVINGNDMKMLKFIKQ